eukprot:CAMPEP_0185034546 /NCGR_PEP_ID=MMETSP1103-20130426/24526_1 /TAXON_ID=36769 /ORGANISM="Paraphysomonas bandaiensis, Strain Caron Lab Isolate" /LENGTH=479 /DNA_ID=CAMNT_0027571247 /DNA_START=163 /DNA_END=1602 /DNA_ORIENTATION=+
MNAVFKIAPWHPDVSGFDPDNSLSDIDAANLNNWGFNIIRLGVMWPGVEPGKQGDYNMTYLDQLSIIVDNLAAQNITVILDMHQDLWHRKFCGEGVPDYIYEICASHEASVTPPFPEPVAPAPYPLDSDGNPSFDACSSKPFFEYYFSAEVGAGFDCLYRNQSNVWEAYAGFWRTVAERFRSYDSVIGYELINEPWAGDVYHDKSLFLTSATEKENFQPMYSYLHEAIREVDDKKIIFFEGLSYNYWWSGFTQGPGGPEYNDRQAISYRIYCPPNGAVGVIVCRGLVKDFLTMRLRDSKRLRLGMMMTEFGATLDEAYDLRVLENLAAHVDEHAQSWMYWQFKYYHDITTMNPQRGSLYSDNGQPSVPKLRILSRTYPQAVAGRNPTYSFNNKNGHFTLTYAPYIGSAEDSMFRTTEIFYNAELFYPNGVQVEIKSGGNVEVKCGHLNHLYLVHDSTPDGPIDVSLVPCDLNDPECTCR